MTTTQQDLRKTNRGYRLASPRALFQMIVIAHVTILLAFLVVGCSKDTSGDPVAMQNLLGRRVGVVVRVGRYVNVTKKTKHTTKHDGRPVIDSPELAHSFALRSVTAIERSLQADFEVVPFERPGNHTESFRKGESTLEGDQILVSPRLEVREILPRLSDTLEGALNGLIIIDQQWTIDNGTGYIVCRFTAKVLDSEGSTILFREPRAGGWGQGRVGARYTTLGGTFFEALTFRRAIYSDKHLAVMVSRVGRQIAQDLLQTIREFVEET